MNHKFFQNTACKYFPCKDTKDLNCLFCFCPLYPYACGGNYSYTKGIKDCSKCLLPHGKDGYDKVIDKLCEIHGWERYG